MPESVAPPSPAFRRYRRRCRRRGSRAPTGPGRTACGRTATSCPEARTRGRRSPSRSCTAVWPLGKPGGIVYPAGEKYGWVWSTPSSMMPIFIAVALGSGAPSATVSRPHATSAASAEATRVGGAGVDRRHAGKGAQPRDRRLRHHDRGAVEDEPVAPPDARLRDALVERGCEPGLLAIDRVLRRAAGRLPSGRREEAMQA